MSKLKMNIGKAKYENSRLLFFEFLHLFVMCTVMDAPTTPINPKNVIHKPKSLLNMRPRNRVNGMARAIAKVCVKNSYIGFFGLLSHFPYGSMPMDAMIMYANANMHTIPIAPYDISNGALPLANFLALLSACFIAGVTTDVINCGFFEPISSFCVIFLHIFLTTIRSR